MNRLKNLLTRWRERWYRDQPPPPPDLRWPAQVRDLDGEVVDVVVGQGWHRLVIVRDATGLFRLQLQAWAPDWGMSHEATWFGHGHIGSMCDSLERARILADEQLTGIGEAVVRKAVEQADAADEVRNG